MAAQIFDVGLKAALVLCAGAAASLLYTTVLPPANLRPLPRVSYWDELWAWLRKDPSLRRYERLMRAKIERHGLCLTYSFGRWTLNIADPVLATVITNAPDEYPKQALPGFIARTLGMRMIGRENVAFSNGKAWKDARHALLPAFAPDWTSSTHQSILSSLLSLFSSHLPPSSSAPTSIDIVDPYRRALIDILFAQLLSYPFSALDDPDDEVVVAYKALMGSSRNLLRGVAWALVPALDGWMQTKARRKDLEYLARLESLFDEMIDASLNENGDSTTPGKKRKDVLTMLAKYHKEGKLSRKAMRDNLGVLFLAGQDTTLGALVEVSAMLAAYPSYQTSIRAEITAFLARHGSLVVSKFDELVELRHFILEVERLHPPVQAIPQRENLHPLTLAGYAIPARTKINVNLQAMHRHPRYWRDPDRFDPGRWADPAEGFTEGDRELGFVEGEGKKVRAFMPFGAGPRICIGQRFATNVIIQIMCTLLPAFELGLPGEGKHLGFETDGFPSSGGERFELVFRRIGNGEDA